MNSFVRAIAAAVMFAAIGGAPVSAITVDDFSIGPLSLPGPHATATQSPLDPAHVFGGRRDISVGSAGTASGLEIATSSGLMTFSSGPSRGYMTLDYGLVPTTPANFAANGHDRLRIRFINVTSATPFLSSLIIRDASGAGKSPNFTDALTAMNGQSGVVEMPFSLLTLDYGHITRITLDVGRYVENQGFGIDEIVTAGPPQPGDYNRDGQVDSSDYQVWLNLAGRKLTTGMLFAADGNANGFVDAADYTIWRDNLRATSLAVSSSTPEPAGIILGLLAMIGAVRLRRRFR